MKQNISFLLIIMVFSCVKAVKDEESVNEIVVKEHQTTDFDAFKNGLIDPSKLKDLNKYIDWDHILLELESELPDLNKQYLVQKLESFKKGFSQDLFIDGINTNDVLANITNSYIENGIEHITVEFYTGDNFQFIEFEIDTSNNLISDLWVYGIGESLSNIIINDVIFNYDENLKASLAWYKLAQDSYSNGDIQSAWDQLANIPEEYQMDFPFRNLKLQITEYDPELHAELIIEMDEIGFDKRYTSFLHLTNELINEQPKGILKAANDISNPVGESVVLQLYKAYAFEIQGDRDLAHQNYRKVTELMPKHIIGYLNQVDLYSRERNTQEAISIINKANVILDMDLDDWINALPEHESFLRQLNFRN